MSEAKLTKEQVHDTLISPLMKQVQEVCEAHGIGWLAVFCVSNPGEDDFTVTSVALGGEKHSTKKMQIAATILDPNTEMVPLRMHSPDCPNALLDDDGEEDEDGDGESIH